MFVKLRFRLGHIALLGVTVKACNLADITRMQCTFRKKTNRITCIMLGLISSLPKLRKAKIFKSTWLDVKKNNKKNQKPNVVF
jgi:hypothetical protein